jgi:hypothetical protein
MTAIALRGNVGDDFRYLTGHHGVSEVLGTLECHEVGPRDSPVPGKVAREALALTMVP